MKSILDSAFRYVPSAQTDLRKSFAKYRKEQREAERKAAADLHERVIRTVTPFRGR